MNDAGFMIRLAEQNLANGDHDAGLTCLEQALAHEPSPQERSVVSALAQEVIDAGGSGVEKARWVAARAQGLKVGGSPKRPAVAPVAQGSQTLDAVQTLLNSQEGRPALSLSAADVITRLLTAELDVGRTATLALEFVAEATAASRAHLILAESSQTSYGLGEGPARPPETSRGVLEEVQRTRRTVRVDDATTDGRFAERESVREQSLGAVLCVPIVAEADLVGAIYLEAPGGRRFSAADQLLGETLAGLIGPSLRAGCRFKAQGEAVERAERRASRDRREAIRREGGPVIIGDGPRLKALQVSIDRYALGNHPVLIEGESGTGKELVARALHARSDRADGPFEAQNMGALTPSLAEAQLFGHEQGAFTGADQARPGLFRLAHGGTLLLDEIGELELPLQAKLLRVLQEGEVRPLGGNVVAKVDVRIVAATHRDLLADVRAGRFREDLYYRLSVLKLPVPALRDRVEDIPVLLEHFLTEQAAELNLSIPQIPDDLMARLVVYGWPGNVRQLQGYVTRLLLTGPLGAWPDGPQVARASGESRLSVEVALEGGDPYPLREARKVFDAAFLRIVLSRGDRVGEVATALGIHRSYLAQLMKNYGISKR